MSTDTKIVLCGAGSAGFGLDSIGGLIHQGELLEGATVTLLDVDRDALETVETIARMAIKEYGASFEVESTTDRRAAFEGADFVVISVEQAHMPNRVKDFKIPLRHGIRQGFGGENGGPGGLAHSLRQIALILDIARDVEDVAPDAFVLEYANPLTRVCLALTRYTKLEVLGFCHGINWMCYPVGRALGWIDASEGSPEEDAQWTAAYERLQVEAAGVNHLTFATKLIDRETGEDVYDEFRERIASYDPSFEPFSRRVMDAFGLYPVQGDQHVGEYFAWAPPVADDHLSDWQDSLGGRAQRLADVIAGKEPVKAALRQMVAQDLEHGPWIIGAMIAGRTQFEPAVNIPNNGAITGLPDWALVEVPGIVGPAGAHGLAVGELPRPITALLSQQVAIADRIVEAAVHGDREAALQAMLLDPVSNADYDVAVALLDELLEAHAAYLPQFAAPAAA